MTIYFENNSFKYEIEAVMKLFCPLETFGFEFDKEPQKGDNTVIITVADRLRVYANIAGTSCEKEEELPPENERELALCRMLFKALSEITGITPEWGCLTGIRPVKKINALLEEGHTTEEAYRILNEKYFISPGKFQLAAHTALTQKKALDTLSSKSYSLYIGIPFCPSRCSYCSFVSHSIQSKGAKELVPQYVDMLCREITELGDIVKDSDFFCDTIYIGGGTPTSLSAQQLDRIMKTIANSIDISHIREYNVEAGRADTITEDKLIAIRDNGATRISVNPQTMQDSVLEAIGRKHTAAQTEACFNLARKLGFNNINMDTIAGLPTDNFDGFADTIDRLTQLDPENITVHTLTVKRSAALFSSAESYREGFSDGKEISAMVNFAYDVLTACGYAPYYLYRQKNTVGNLENVGYAKEGKEGLYNIYIMEEAQNILACGASGSTKLIDMETSKIARHFNYKFPYEYISRYDRMTEYKPEVRAFLNNH